MSVLNDVIAIVSEAVGIEATAESASGREPAWDSLSQIAVLDGLDQAWPGITAKYPALSSAESVAEIVAIVQADTP